MHNDGVMVAKRFTIDSIARLVHFITHRNDGVVSIRWIDIDNLVEKFIFLRLIAKFR